MRRKGFVLLTVIWLVGMVAIPGGCAWAASEAATLKSVALSTGSKGTELVVHVDGDFTYKTVRAGSDTLFIDIANAKADGIARSQQWANPVFGGYKLMSFKDASGEPVVRVQVDTKLPNSFVAFKDGANLRLINGMGADLSAAHSVAENPSPAAPVAADSPAPAAVSADSTKPLLVSKITLDKHDSGETFVDVTTSRSASFHVMTLPSPSRLVVDIDGAESTSATKTFEADTTVLKAVRIGQFRANDPAVVRVVAVLNGNPAFDVHTTTTGVQIELRPRGMARPVPLASSAPAPQAKPAEKAVEAAVVSTPVAPVPAAPAAVPAAPVAAVAAPEPKPAETNEIAKPDVQSTLPTTVQAAAAPLPPPAASTPEALRAEHAAEVLNPAVQTSSAEAQAAPPATPVAPPAEVKPVYTGEPVTFNLKDLDLKDFFRLIHEISGLNIIVDPNVSGSVTIVLDSVPWDQALDIVLKNNDLGKVLEGNVLRIAKMSTLTSEQDAQTKLVESRINAAPLVTVFRPINYATAQAIQTILKSWTGGGALTRRGIVLVDARSNTLIISDVASQIPIIEAIINRLDRKAKQVSIEARVVLATADFTRILSAALAGAGLNNSGTTTFGLSTGTNATITGPTTSTTSPGAMTISSAAGSGFGNIAITNATARYIINGVISAQEERDQAKTISRPTIVTQNNVQGMVQQGVEIPIQTTINNTISVTYQAATLQLQVTPQVTDDNNIFLVINVNNASVGAPVVNVGAEINTQQATTSVLVPDGGTVVFGGITVTTRSKAATYVPILGNIPILGNLFKTSTTTNSDQELLFFVSPKVLPS